MRWTNKIELEELKKKMEKALVESGNGSSRAAQLLGMSTTSFWRYSKKLGLQKLRPDGRGVAHMKPSVPLYEILEGKHPKYNATNLKERLFHAKLKEQKCEICKIESWQNRSLTFQLDHIDGNHQNHQFKNLRILCPNCHSQTLTYSGKRCRLNHLSDNELRTLIFEANKNHQTLRAAGNSLGISAGHFRKLLKGFINDN